MEAIQLPKRKPRIILKEQAPDQRKFAVIPIRAITDRNLTGMELRVLMAFCSYCNRGGLTWVSLKRIGSHFNIKVSRTSRLAKALIDKGYMRVLYKGFAGQRAQTRQVIFDSTLTLADIVAISGEKPPYLQEQENRQLNQSLKEEEMKKQARAKKQTVDNKADNNLKPESIVDRNKGNGITKEQKEQLQRIVSADVLEEAIKRAGEGADLAAVERALQRMLM